MSVCVCVCGRGRLSLLSSRAKDDDAAAVATENVLALHFLPYFRLHKQQGGQCGRGVPGGRDVVSGWAIVYERLESESTPNTTHMHMRIDTLAYTCIYMFMHLYLLCDIYFCS